MSRSHSPGAPPQDLTEALLGEAGWVRALSARLARDQAVADDVAQATLVLALERRPRVGGSLRPWLGFVVARLVRRERRGSARRHAREQLLARGDTSEDERLLERLELQELLARRVRALPQPYRGVLLRHFYEGAAAADIARELGASPATVRSQIARGLARLRVEFERDQAGGDPRSFGSALGALIIAAGVSAPSVSKGAVGGVLLKTTTKIVAALAVLSLLAAGSYTWISRTVGPPTAESAERDDGTLARIVDPRLAAVDDESGRDEAAQAITPSEEQETLDVPANAVDVEEPAVTTVRATLASVGGAPLPGAVLRSIYVNGKARGADCFGGADDTGLAEIGIPDRFMRHWRTEVHGMTFQATAPMHATSFVASTPEWHGTTDLGTLELEPGGALRGRVTDRAGAAIDGATVYFSSGALVGTVDELRTPGPDLDVRRPLTLSQADGTFEFPGAATGPCRLFIGRDSALWTISEELEVHLGAVTDAGNLVLDPLPAGERIDGTVVAPDGSPVAGAAVSYTVRGRGGEGVVTTGAAGRFTLAPRGPQTARLLARDPEGRYGMSEIATAERGVADLRLELSERRTLLLTVVDDETGAPIEGASTMPFTTTGWGLEGGGSSLPGGEWMHSDSRGQIPFPVPSFDFKFAVSQAGYEAQRFGPYTLDEAPETLEVRLKLEPSVTGRVLAYGQPVAGATVEIGQRIEGFVPQRAGFPMRFFINRGHGVPTDAEGRFVCPIDKDWTDVTVLASAPGWASGELELTLEASAGKTDVEVNVTRGGAVEGRVTPPAQRAAEGIRIVASCGDGRPRTTRAEADGTYRLDALMPGPWRFVPMLEEPNSEVTSVAQGEEDKRFRWNVEVLDGETTKLDVDARHLAPTPLHGRLLMAGRPAAGFTATVLQSDLVRYTTDRAASEVDGDGYFVLELPVGAAGVHFVGALESGQTVEITRWLELAGQRIDWEEDLQLGEIDEVIDLEAGPYRILQGADRNGDSVKIDVEPDENGRVTAKAPVGTSWIERRISTDNWVLWSQVRRVDVKGD